MDPSETAAIVDNVASEARPAGYGATGQDTRSTENQEVK